MDHKSLEQLKHLQKEIRQLERQIKQLRNTRIQRGHMVADTVQASSRHFPYTQYCLSIKSWAEGDDIPAKNRFIQELEGQLKAKKTSCWEELLKINTWINNLPDSETRQIMRMRYIEGLSLKEIGKETDYELSTIGKKIKKIVG